MGKEIQKNKKIDVIIPAYKAQGTMFRTLSSIACQSIIDDIEVTIVNDCCPNGDYKEFVDLFSPFFPIKEIKLEENGGPGVARQAGIDATNNEFFTCIDADDTFNGSIALEILRTGLEESPANQCASATFLQVGKTIKETVPIQNDMVWMFGKLYRRDFIDKYKIRFNTTRANEDTGFNMMVKLLCDNPNEQIRFIPEVVYLWHYKPDSITRINDGQYQYDQCMCGWTDNMIYAFSHVKKLRPFSGTVIQNIAATMLNLYFYYIETVARKPIFADQNWEYIKKFYHAHYKKLEDDITDEALSELFGLASREKYGSGSMMGIIPSIGIKEFLTKLKEDPYNEDDIYTVWEKMSEDEEGKQLIENNEHCGVCPTGYATRKVAETKDEEEQVEEKSEPKEKKSTTKKNYKKG